ncbi:ATPase [Vibrio cidicii]|uniref:ATPase n=1 Tax=Vibrio cidicii TaxID=1763883 RepID=A0A151KU08_9VIBR|nr:hypothetical protein [Vibrio cidicii]KYN82298.1 ATPase [Vibrio cidicii]
MALDTRGFVDGALQGFQAAEGYYQRKKDNERQDRLDERDEQRYQYEKTRLSQLDEQDRKRYESEAAYNRSRNAQADKRADAELTLRQIEAKQRGTLLDAQISTQKSNKELHDFELGQKKKLAYLQENMPVIQSNLKSFMETGQLDPMFDHEYIKGSAYDPRRYTPRVVQAAFDIYRAMPKLNDGSLSYHDPVFTKALGVLYERNIKQGIGDVDPETGKVIKDKEYLRHDFVADIDPNQEGEQPGVVFGLKVTYEDGTSQVAPVTKGRKPGAGQSVMVIPLTDMIRDVGEQTKKAMQFYTSEHYSRLFSPKDKNESADIEKQWRTARTDIETDRAEALNQLMNPSPEQIKAVNDRFNERRTAIDQIYGKLGGESGGVGGHKNAASQWAGNDPQKQQFIAELGQTMDVAKIPVEALEHNYQRVLKAKQDKQSEEQKKALLAKIKSENSKDEPSNYDRQAQEYAERSPEWMNSLSDVVSGAFKTPEAKSIKESDYTDYNSVVRPF